MHAHDIRDHIRLTKETAKRLLSGMIHGGKQPTTTNLGWNPERLRQALRRQRADLR